ncbi:hypothetical protein [Paracoccus litorisediminis]|uniref:Uncharacterized protein n=1 Tax=Paracoccus litorisediminis TaxID=2006130 RepID=A0A844HLF1_9RHOB|nr:hypothetical protein [Paracoccus litorisediminis]MTH61093.1 hypothetical protein [Paracoccus litorisediminis]
MNTSDLFQFTPGCFGSTYFAKDSTCGVCPFAPDCEKRSVQTMDDIRAICGVVTRKRRAGKGELSEKAREVFEKLGKSAREVRASLMGGENPYPTNQGFMGDVCQILLHFREVKTAFLATVIAERCKLRPSTAASYTKQAVAILQHCEAADIQGDSISLRRG